MDKVRHSPTRVAFRLDASKQIGGGHAVRCAALAHALAARGAETLFLVNHGATTVAPVLERLNSVVLPSNVTVPGNAERAALRSVWPQGAHVIVVDHYGLEAIDETPLRTEAERIAVLDDLVDRPHDCDLLFDQTCGRDQSEYRPLLPPTARVYTGADFALLRPEFRSRRDEALSRRANSGPVQRVLVSFGLTDFGNLSEPVCRCLSGRGLAIDVVIGLAARQSREALLLLSAEQDDVTIHRDLDADEIADVMVNADLAVGALGTTSWERCCLGLPTVAVPTASNQLNVARALAEAGAVRLVNAFDPLKISAEALDLAGNVPDRKAMSLAAAVICDGQGTERVARILAEPRIILRRARLADAEAVFEMRQGAAHFFRLGQDTSWSDHSIWFAKAVTDESRDLLMCEAGGVAVAHVRFDKLEAPNTESRIVSICVAPEFRGKGFAAPCLVAGCTWSLDNGAKELFADIHEANEASHAVFVRCGFKRCETSSTFHRYVLHAHSETS